MNNRGDKWAGLLSGYPNFSSPYWRALPLGRMKKLLVGVFFITGGVGFAVDLFLIDHPPLAHGWFWPLFLGVMAASVFAARIKGPRLALFAWLLMVVLAIQQLWNGWKEASWKILSLLRAFVPDISGRLLFRTREKSHLPRPARPR